MGSGETLCDSRVTGVVQVDVPGVAQDLVADAIEWGFQR